MSVCATILNFIASKMDGSFAEKRRVYQLLESKIWKALFDTTDDDKVTAKWFKMKIWIH
jgi:hypothetical protein